MSVINGLGMLGVGGAIGPGNAANAGYHGRPGTLTDAWNCVHCKPIPAAMALARVGKLVRAWDMIRGVQGGPTIWPPIAVTALTCTPTSVAAVCHDCHAEQIASHIPGIKSRYLLLMFFFKITSALEFDAAPKRA